jgi:primosomal protein N' (replication factor Y)
MICLRLQSQEENSGQKAVDHLKNRLQDLVQKRTEYQTAIRLLGPVVAPLARVKGQFRWQILLKSAYPSVLHRFTFQIRKILEQDPYFRALRFQVDVDPGNLL